mgnify:CR=1 FL=1
MKDRLERIVARLEHFRLARLERTPAGRISDDDSWGLSDEDVEGTLVEHRAAPLLFGTFPTERVMADFECIGMLDRCRKLGYDELRVEFSARDAFESRFCLMAHHPDVDEPCRLIDIRTHQCEFNATSPLDGTELHMRALLLDWVSMEDPVRPLPVDALPGQKSPGLGIFRPGYRLTMSYLRRTSFDVVVNIPEFFHNAVLYSRDFRFFDPVRQGMFLAMKRDLMKAGLSRVSHAMSPAAEGPVATPVEHVELREHPECVRWSPAEQILALSGPIQDYIHDPRYTEAVHTARAGHHYFLTRKDDDALKNADA